LGKLLRETWLFVNREHVAHNAANMSVLVLNKWLRQHFLVLMGSDYRWTIHFVFIGRMLMSLPMEAISVVSL